MLNTFSVAFVPVFQHKFMDVGFNEVTARHKTLLLSSRDWCQISLAVTNVFVELKMRFE